MSITRIGATTGNTQRFAAARTLLHTVRLFCRWAARSAEYDPVHMTEAQRRDAGIHPVDAERIQALRRPLIR